MRSAVRLWATAAILGATLVSGGCGNSSTTGAGTTASSDPTAAGATTSATTAPPKTGAKGCDLVSQSEASAAEGHPLGPGGEAPSKIQAPVVAHSGCLYSDGIYAIGYDLNTFGSSIAVPTYEQAAWTNLRSKLGAKSTTIGGNPAITYTLGHQQVADFYKGDVTVIVSSSNGKPGAALTVATLIAQRM